MGLYPTPNPKNGLDQEGGKAPLPSPEINAGRGLAEVRKWLNNPDRDAAIQHIKGATPADLARDLVILAKFGQHESIATLARLAAKGEVIVQGLNMWSAVSATSEVSTIDPAAIFRAVHQVGHIRYASIVMRRIEASGMSDPTLSRFKAAYSMAAVASPEVPEAVLNEFISAAKYVANANPLDIDGLDNAVRAHKCYRASAYVAQEIFNLGVEAIRVVVRIYSRSFELTLEEQTEVPFVQDCKRLPSQQVRRIGSPATRELCALLTSSEERVRCAAACLVGVVDPNAGFPALSKLASSTDFRSTDGCPNARAGLVRAIARAGDPVHSTNQIELLLRALREDSSSEVKYAALRGLKPFADQLHSLRAELKPLLLSESIKVRGAAGDLRSVIPKWRWLWS